MIPITLFLIYILVVLLCAGGIGLRFLTLLTGSSVKAGEAAELTHRWSDLLLLGVVVLTTAASLVSLIHPLDLVVFFSLSGLTVVFGWPALRDLLKPLFQSRSRWKLTAVGVCGLICLGVLIFVATGAPNHYDTGLYHAQMVQWNKQFGVVPGLANLQGRFGFNSAWDLFASFLDQGYFTGRSFHIVELVVATIFLVACLEGYVRLFAGDRAVGTILRCLGMLVLIHDFRSLLPSLSTDWPTALLVYYIVILVAEHLDKSARPAQPDRLLDLGLVATFSAFAVTVKLSTAPILLLSLLWLAGAQKKKRVPIIILVCGMCIAIPFVLRNIVLTGYLFYPVTALDLFGFDWKVPATDVHLMSSIIKYWAINPVDDWYRAEHMTLPDEVRTWWKWRRGEATEFVPFFSLGVIGWLGVISSRKGRSEPGFAGGCAICFVLLGGITFCLVNAPEPRFASGWFLTFALFSAAWVIHAMTASLLPSGNQWRLIGYLLLFSSTLCLGRNAGVKRIVAEKGAFLWELPDFPQVKLKQVRTERSVTLKIPAEGDRMWNAPLPVTTPLGVNPWLEMRGTSLKDGFRVTKPGYAIGKESLQPGDSLSR